MLPCSVMISPPFTLSVKLLLEIIYPEKYPDVIPEMALTPTEGELETSEMDSLIDQLKSVVCVSCKVSCSLAECMHFRGRIMSESP